jgi:methionyl-tRNA formyltransferase
MTPLRIVFFGSPAFAVPTLREVDAAGHRVVAVVTQPDKPRGRGQQTTRGPVAAFAAGHGLPLLQPARIRDDAFLSALAGRSPELGIVAAYGKILPASLLAIPRLGLINVHASLLPRWRGASPIHRAVMAGDAETGVSIMRVVEALDAGGVFAEARRPIGADETSEEVERDLAELGARLILPVIEGLADGTARETPQDEALVTYAPRLAREDGLIRWDSPAAVIHNQVRGLHPWPHAATSLGGARVIVHRTRLGPPAETRRAGQAAPGEVLSISRDGVAVMTGDAAPLTLLQLQAEGRRAVSARDFAAGARLAAGARFGS